MVLQWTLPWPYNTPNMALYKLAILLHSTQQKWDEETLWTQRSTLQWTLTWSFNTTSMTFYILAIFGHSMQQKLYQGTLGTQRSTLIGSRTRLGPSMDPAMALQYT